ncbi:hypothetical protein [Bifidobacterium adolescentis]|uniref:hypothetical protein n=2 Tax=Bifidobacterium adolescentis TaxID=1680 RepID=UPI0034A33488
MKMSSGAEGKDNSIPLSIARHQGIEAVSCPKLIADCFWTFSELFSEEKRRPSHLPSILLRSVMGMRLGRLDGGPDGRLGRGPYA